MVNNKPELNPEMLLRRVYDIVKESHLNDITLTPYYWNKFEFPKKLANDIYSYLQIKDKEKEKNSKKITIIGLA